MIIELEINGARVIICGDNLSVNVTQDEVKREIVTHRVVGGAMPTAEQIKNLRKRLALTQSGFSQLMKVSQGTVCRWESGTDEPHGEAAVRLADMISASNPADKAFGIVALRDWLKAGHGRQSALAEALDITTAAIPQWREVPADKLLKVERVTGISRKVFRPDLYEGLPA